MNFYEMKYQENNTGFSIIELLVVIALISVISVFAYPNLAKYNQRREIQNAVNKLYEHLQNSQSNYEGRNIS